MSGESDSFHSCWIFFSTHKISHAAGQLTIMPLRRVPPISTVSLPTASTATIPTVILFMATSNSDPVKKTCKCCVHRLTRVTFAIQIEKNQLRQILHCMCRSPGNALVDIHKVVSGTFSSGVGYKVT